MFLPATPQNSQIKKNKNILGSCLAFNLSNLTLEERFKAVMKNFEAMTSPKEELKNQKEELKSHNNGLFFSCVNCNLPTSTHWNPLQPISTHLKKNNNLNQLQPTSTDFNQPPS